MGSGAGINAGVACVELEKAEERRRFLGGAFEIGQSKLVARDRLG